ncbi:MAG: Mur ligase family protein [Treponema sp.]|nr:Mur ligase family protein [Treponema sp.]
MVTSTPFTSSSDVYQWLSSFTNLERGQNLRNFSLDRMNSLARMSGHPETCAPVFHAAGSKGKGSVTGMMTAILSASGIKTAGYASPHVIDFRERLTVGNKFFDEAVYIAAGNELKKIVDGIPASADAKLFDLDLDSGEAASFFELATLWFFLCARIARCGAMSIETGMGGRLDATNIVDPAVSVITVIELEHTEYLGSTIAAISGEKAGIIKLRRPVVVAKQRDDALEVFRQHAEQKKSPLYYFPECAEIRDVRVNREGTYFTLDLKHGDCKGEVFTDLLVPIPGEVQAYNAGLAILSLKVAGVNDGMRGGIGGGACAEITEESIRAGLAGFTLPARFQRVAAPALAGVPMVIDGAHTPGSVRMCVDTFAELYGEGAILVFGCADGKDFLSMAKVCTPRFSSIIITTPGTFKKSNPAEVYAAFLREAQTLVSPPRVVFIPDTAHATAEAIRLARDQKLAVLGTGSFYLAAEIRKAAGE